MKPVVAWTTGTRNSSPRPLCFRHLDCHVTRIPNSTYIRKKPREIIKSLLNSFFFFLAVPYSTRDLSFLTRDQTCVPCSGSTILTTGSAGKSQEPVELRCCPLTVVGPGAHYFASLNLSFWLCSLTVIRTYHK